MEEVVQETVQETVQENTTASKPKKLTHEIFDWADSMLFVLVAVILVLTFAIRGTVVDGESMYPTLDDGHFLMLSPILPLNHNDIVVVYAHKLAANDGTGGYGKPIIKRVIGLPGDMIYIDRETGEVLHDITNDDGLFKVNTYVVPENHIFVLGDNRHFSMDSRHPDVGMIEYNYIIGKVLFRVTPFELFGAIK
ncbi:MAG: signal peptidase I [Oscillospiraceae bacterium]|nr:signal peptidase I [Oscillospiraceae bacterium]